MTLEEQLKQNLEFFLVSVQEEEGREMGPEWGKGGKYDPFADTGVWIGSDLPSNRKGWTAVLHFDGAGYDYLSCDSGLEMFRKSVEEIAKKLGFSMTDLNTWSIGFTYDPNQNKRERK
jgi:hypothetical protein